MITVTLRGKDTTFDVPGQPTAITAVYITPVVDMTPGRERYTGDWALTHAPSGRIFPVKLLSPTDLYDLAEDLALVSADWSGLGEDPKLWPVEIRQGIVDATVRWRAERHDERIIAAAAVGGSEPAGSHQ